MNAVRGTWKNGQIVPDQPVAWPEGCRLVIEPVEDEETVGIREEDWPDSPEAIAEWLRWYDSLEPILMTPEEEANWQAARQEQREFEKSTFEERAKRIEGLFP